ncbi:MAG TPA: hypothetical protein VFB44_11525 [Thermoleophilaceae bacterium]|nr:hypothetical protein [Thermoleophilaceae bacterium]
MRPRDPRRLIERRRRARVRVTILHVPQSGHDVDGSIGSCQTAEVSLPREDLDRIWSAEYLERLARTYWHFLTRISLGVLRVEYGPDSREVVVFRRPFVMLRFHKPEYETHAERGSVTWPIDRGLLVAPNGRGRGYLRLSVERRPASDGAGEASVTVSSEVVNFYPLIAGWGWFGRIGRMLYNQTQLRIHVVVTNAFLRSLANLELERSVVGVLSPAAPPLSPAASPGRDEP